MMAKKKDLRFTGALGPQNPDPMQFHIPERLSIIGQAWTVLIVPKWSEDAIGDCNYQMRTIRIMAGLDPCLTVETFIHEVLHAMLGSIGIEHDEAVVNSLAPVLLDTFRANRFTF